MTSARESLLQCTGHLDSAVDVVELPWRRRTAAGAPTNTGVVAVPHAKARAV